MFLGVIPNLMKSHVLRAIAKIGLLAGGTAFIGVYLLSFVGLEFGPEPWVYRGIGIIMPISGLLYFFTAPIIGAPRGSVISIPLWRGFGRCVFYVLFSWMTLVVTSGGWTGFGLLFAVGGAFVVVLLAVLVILAICSLRGRKSFVLPRNSMLALLSALVIVQSFLWFFNYGDCGDGAGSYNYVQQLVAIGKDPCRNGGNAWLSNNIVAVGYLGYFLLWVVVLFYLFFHTSRASAKERGMS